MCFEALKASCFQNLCFCLFHNSQVLPVIMPSLYIVNKSSGIDSSSCFCTQSLHVASAVRSLHAWWLSSDSSPQQLTVVSSTLATEPRLWCHWAHSVAAPLSFDILSGSTLAFQTACESISQHGCIFEQWNQQPTTNSILTRWQHD